MPSVGLGMREPHVARDRRSPGASGARRREVRLGELVAARERRAAPLLAPDDPVLLRQPHAIPRLDEHRDLAGDEVRAPRHPCRLIGCRDPHVVGERLGVVGEDVRRAVLEAEEVPRGRLRGGRARRAAEAELRPAQPRAPEGDAAEVADRVDGDLRVVGARLDAQVAARGIRGRGRRRRRPAAARAPRDAAPRCRSGRRRPPRRASDRTRSDRQAGSRGARAPRPCRRAAPRGNPPTAPVALTSRPCVMRDGGVRPVLQQRDEVVADRSRAIMSNDAKCRWSCTGVVMPA